MDNMINKKKNEIKSAVENKTSENVRRSFSHTTSDDKEWFAEIPIKRVVNGKPNHIFFFVFISEI
jgi:hypothetical protein